MESITTNDPISTTLSPSSSSTPASSSPPNHPALSSVTDTEPEEKASSPVQSTAIGINDPIVKKYLDLALKQMIDEFKRDVQDATKDLENEDESKTESESLSQERFYEMYHEELDFDRDESQVFWEAAEQLVSNASKHDDIMTFSRTYSPPEAEPPIVYTNVDLNGLNKRACVWALARSSAILGKPWKEDLKNHKTDGTSVPKPFCTEVTQDGRKLKRYYGLGWSAQSAVDDTASSMEM